MNRPALFFQDKVIWVTGASSGIGEALAHALARCGARLVLSARREAELQRVAAATGLPPERVLVLPMDMTDPQTFPEKVQTLLQHFGQLDGVVQNAGLSQRGPAAETPLAVDRHLMEVNYFGVVALTKVTLPIFIHQESGLYVPISSIAGLVATPQRSAYAASKFALRGFFDALRAEVWQQGIQVSTICPGYIRTHISVNALNARGEPNGRMDENQARGLPADQCAERILRAVAAGRRETYIGGLKEVAGAYLKRYTPGLLWRLIRRYNIRSEPV